MIAIAAGCDHESVWTESADPEYSDFIQTHWLNTSFKDLLQTHGYGFRGGGSRAGIGLSEAEQSIRLRAVGVAGDRDRLLHLYYAAIKGKLTDMEADIYFSSGPVLSEVSHFEIAYDYRGVDGNLRVFFSLDSAGYIDVDIENTERLR